MRIGVAGISHEALTFSPVLACMKDFVVWRKEAVPKSLGITDMLGDHEIEFVPILFARSMAPSGVVEEATYLQLREEIAKGFREAGSLDGICLVFHGAMLVQNIWSGETDLVREVRAIVGNDIPLCARFDLHANLTEELANKVDIWTGFRTAPHRDAEETTRRAIRLLVRCIREGFQPQPVFVRVPLLLQGEKALTNSEPMVSLLKMARASERCPGILSADILVGFGWADAAHAGSSVVAIAENKDHLPEARRHALHLAQAMWDQRSNFTFDREVAPSADAAIDLALAAPEQCVFLSDSGDNLTAGATGDVPYFLSRLLARNVPDAIIAPIADAEAYDVCKRAGVGTTVTLTVGGKLDRTHGDPINVTGIVEHLYQPPAGVHEAALATMKTGGMHIVISDIRRAFRELEDFRRAGLEALDHKLVVIKLGHLMPDLRDAAPREILAITPGCAAMDLNSLPYTYVTRPIFPLDRDFQWKPMITNRAGYATAGD